MLPLRPSRSGVVRGMGERLPNGPARPRALRALRIGLAASAALVAFPRSCPAPARPAGRPDPRGGQPAAAARDEPPPARLTVEGDVERAPCALDRPEYANIRFTLTGRRVRRSARPDRRAIAPGLRPLRRAGDQCRHDLRDTRPRRDPAARGRLYRRGRGARAEDRRRQCPLHRADGEAGRHQGARRRRPVGTDDRPLSRTS